MKLNDLLKVKLDRSKEIEEGIERIKMLKKMLRQKSPLRTERQVKNGKSI